MKIKTYRKKKRGLIKSFFLYSFIFFSLLLFLGAAGGGVFGYFYLTRLSKELPDVMTLKEYKPSLITKVFDDNGKLISEFYVEKRILLSSDRIPDAMKNATISVEDSAFYSHRGINLKGIFRAMIANIRAGGVVEGGSTITQQLTKTMFLTPERKIKRKVKELILALKIEKNFSKEEIILIIIISLNLNP
ncbi:MAG: transglycosylase domain-containing protein, partial [Nitrospinota bacterium]